MFVMWAAGAIKALRHLPSLLRYTASFFPNRPATNRDLFEGLRLSTGGGALRLFATHSWRGGKGIYIEQNKKIAEFERNQDWRGLLDCTEGKSAGSDYTSWATTFAKLGRFRRDARDITRDPGFRVLVAGLEERVDERNFGTQAITNVSTHLVS